MLCALNADVPLDVSGRTLRDEPIRAAGGGPGGRCALVCDYDPAEWVGARRMSVEVPGVGPVHLGGVTWRQWLLRPLPEGAAAPTRDGGVVDISGFRIDAAGIPIERVFTGLSAEIAYHAWRDLGGDGLYAARSGQSTEARWIAVGSHTALPPEEAWAWLGGVAGGGALLARGDEWVRFGEGAPTPVPAAQRQAVFDVLQAAPAWDGDAEGRVVSLEGGDLCVERAPAIACVSADGRTRSVAEEGVAVGVVEGHSFWPLPGGDPLVLGGGGTIQRLDPGSMSLEAFAEVTPSGLSTDGVERVWATCTVSSNGPWQYAELTDAGPVEVSPLNYAQRGIIPHPLGRIATGGPLWSVQWR